MMTFFASLLILSVKGSVLILFTLLLNKIFKNIISPKILKALLLCSFIIGLIPFHFLEGWNAKLVHFPQTTQFSQDELTEAPATGLSFTVSSVSSNSSISLSQILLALWIIGVVISVFKFIFETYNTSHHFGALPQSTDSKLLQELEESKSILDCFVPVGVIETARIQTPAILGWLRPRILLPQKFYSQWSTQERKWVLQHELAHFRSADALGISIARLAIAFHWWNPLFYYAYGAYRDAIEHAADVTVTQKLSEEDTESYAALLIKLSTNQTTAPTPMGALGIRENYQTIKRRIEMIMNPQNKRATILNSFLICMSFIVFTALASFSWSQTEEDQKNAAESATLAWLKIMDEGKYGESHAQASEFFKEELTQKKWVKMAESVRKPLGKILKRQTISRFIQKNVPLEGETIHGVYCIIQMESSFENFKSARETITFELEKDGVWRASGYLIKPN